MLRRYPAPLQHPSHNRGHVAPPPRGSSTAVVGRAAAACRRRPDGNGGARAIGRSAAGHGSTRSHRPQQQRQREPQPRRTELERALHISSTPEELLSLAEQRAHELTPSAAAAALATLSYLLRGSSYGAKQQVVQHPALPRLYRVLQAGAGELQVRQLGSLLQHCVWLSLNPPRPMLEEVAEQLIQRLPAVEPAQACSAASALTKLGSPAAGSLLAAIDRLVQQQQQQQQAAAPPWLAGLGPVPLVRLLWSASKAAFRSAPLLSGITEALLACTPEGQLGQQQVPPTMSDLLQLGPAEPGQPHAGTSGAASRAASEPLAALSEQQLSSVFFSLGTLRWASSQEVRHVARMLLLCMRLEPAGWPAAACSQHARVAHPTNSALPLCSPLCVQFLRAAVQQARGKLTSFSTQGLANTASGISRLGRQSELRPLAAALAAEAVPRISSFTMQELVMLVVAMAVPHAWHDGGDALMDAAAAEVARRAGELAERDLMSLLSGAACASVGRPGFLALALSALDGALIACRLKLCRSLTACSPACLPACSFCHRTVHTASRGAGRDGRPARTTAGGAAVCQPEPWHPCRRQERLLADCSGLVPVGLRPHGLPPVAPAVEEGGGCAAGASAGVTVCAGSC